MKLVNPTILAASLGLFLLIPEANAQFGRNDRYGDYGRRDRNGYGRGSRYGNVIGQVLSDLDRVARSSYSRIDSHERRHIERAISELQRFEDRWRDGRFETRYLDRAIEDLADLANADQLRPNERRMMARNRQMLRDFRASGGSGRW